MLEAPGGRLAFSLFEDATLLCTYYYYVFMCWYNVEYK